MIRSALIFVGCFRYESEINRRNDAENEFVMLKKVQYAGMMAMTDTCCLRVHYSDEWYLYYLYYYLLLLQ